MSTLLVGDATEWAPHSGFGDMVAEGTAFLRKFVASSTATVDRIDFWCRSDHFGPIADHVALGIYADSAGSPAALLASGSAPGPTSYSGEWVSTTGLGLALTSGTPYWLAILPLGGYAYFARDDADTVSYKQTAGLGSLPNPWATSDFSGTTYNFGLKATASGITVLGDDTEYALNDTASSAASDGGPEVFRFTAGATGTVERLKAWVRDDSGFTSCDLLVYADGSDYPGDLLGYATVSPPTPGSGDGVWVEADVAASFDVTTGARYWCGWQSHGGDVKWIAGKLPTLGFDGPNSSASRYDPFEVDGFTLDDDRVSFQALGAAPSSGGLEFHVTGLWYPDAESVTYYGRIADPADGSNVTIPLGDSRLGEVTLSMFDPVVADLVHHAYARMLKVYYNDDIVYWGPVKLNAGKFKDGTVTVNSVDPSIRAIRHYLRRGDIAGDLSAPHDDKSAVTIDGDGFRLLLDAARNIPAQTARGCPDIGIDTGIDGATLRADHLIGISRGQEVWNSILALTQSSLGPDFNLAPTEDIPGSYCELITDDRIGADKTTEVQLHCNTGFKNLDDLEFTEGSEYVTHAHVLSSDGRRVSAVNVEASAETGQYTAWVSTEFSAQGLDPAKLDEALAAVGEAVIENFGRPLVVITLTMPLDTDGGYLYGRDYDVGDTISVAGKKGYVELEEAPYRITQVKLVKEGDGVRPEIQVVPSRTAGDTISTSEDS